MVNVRVSPDRGGWIVTVDEEPASDARFATRTEAFELAREIATDRRPSYIGVDDEAGRLFYDMRLPD